MNAHALNYGIRDPVNDNTYACLFGDPVIDNTYARLCGNPNPPIKKALINNLNEYLKIVFNTEHNSIAWNSELGLELAELSNEFNLGGDFTILFNGKTIFKLNPDAKEFFPPNLPLLNN